MIWEPRYFDRDCQFVVDLFNSFPLIGVAALIAWRLRSTAWLAFCASMALHCVTDLLVHREDARALASGVVVAGKSDEVVDFLRSKGAV